MGTYYKIVNLDKRESINPGAHGHWGVKYGSLHTGGHPARTLLVHALFDRWRGDRIAIQSDESAEGLPGDYDDPELVDVTLELLESAREYLDSDRLWGEVASRILAAWEPW